MLKNYKADLHIHSCLSPCAELDMTPSKIVIKALDAGLDIIAISDHNSAENVEVAIEIAQEHNITVLPAMEITTSEEVHLLALFGNLDDCLNVQKEVHRSIFRVPLYKHDETSQPVVNKKDEILSFNPLPLINATDIPLALIVDLIHNNNGLAVACHIDREAFSIISQLGFIPSGLPLDAVEVSYHVSSDEEAKNFLTGQYYSIASFSDAHYLPDIGRRTTEFYLENPTIHEISMSLRSEGERKLFVLY
ncbi:MAG: PHP domain-containing protein [Thermodesulfovibrionales bacterium]